jgi:tRNA uridine 5-carboxymethylaminomethyl modification enzyme
LLRQPEVRLETLLTEDQVRLDVDPSASTLDIVSVETAVKYEGYLRRQQHEVERSRRDERRRIPPDFPFDQVPGLSREVIQRLSQVRPDTLAHALRIPGVTPAAVAVLSSYVGRFRPGL